MKEQLSVLEVQDLSIAVSQQYQPLSVVKNADLNIKRGEIVAVVGESGSGKTMLARSIIGLLPPGVGIVSGSIKLNGQELVGLSRQALQQYRGSEINLIFQEPMVSFNPVIKIGKQITEAMRWHSDQPDDVIRQRAIDLLEKVRIRDPEALLEKFPHEFSGGMLQRVMIASSLMMSPSLVIADEPTTALDCIVQKEVMEILAGIAQEQNTAILLISHDLALVASYADSVVVLENGNIVEGGSVTKILEQPSHPYTRKLLEAIPTRASNTQKTAISKAYDICRINKLCVDFPLKGDWFFSKSKSTRVLHDIDLCIASGETLGVVGESGSGKTTLGRSIMQLIPASRGSITIDGITVTGPSAAGFKRMSGLVQMIFQNPYSTLSPRQTVAETIAEPLRYDRCLSKEEIQKKTNNMLEEVGLALSFRNRLPNELSGGQRQRVAIARALISEPKLLIADEPVSALDVTVQAQILSLLQRLKKERGFTCLFISHDLSVIEQIADRVAVFHHGCIVEEGSIANVFDSPNQAYTKELLSAIPELRQISTHSYRLKKRSYE